MKDYYAVLTDQHNHRLSNLSDEEIIKRGIYLGRYEDEADVSTIMSDNDHKICMSDNMVCHYFYINAGECK